MARPSKPWFNTGKKAWFATTDGKKVNLGVKGESNKADAERAWHRLMATGPRPAAAKSETVADAVTAFLSASAPSLKPATSALYRRHLDKLAEKFGAMKVTAVTSVALGRWLHGLPVGDTTKAMTLRSVSAFFGWCRHHRDLPANPASMVSPPKARSRGAESVIAADDHARYLALASKALRPVLVLLHATGARPGELCRVTAADLDANSGVVRINEHKADRSGRPRLLFVSGDALELLKGLAAEYPTGPLLRTVRGTAWKPNAVAWAMHKLSTATGVKSTPYGYRHTFATDALVAGVPDAHVAALLGHSSTAMLHRHYSHLAAKTKVLASAAKSVR